MREDLIEHINLSSMSPMAAIEIMDLLLTLDPQLNSQQLLRYHPSWAEIADVFRKQFYGLPKSLLNWAINEEVLLRKEQEKRLNDYAGMELPSLNSSALSLEQQQSVAVSVLRQLLKGHLNLKQGPSSDVVEAIVDLFILPQSDSIPSIGLATFEKSKGGIFKRHIEVGGDHFMLPWSPYWVKSLISKQTLPAHARTIFLSHSPTPLLFQWLYTLNLICPDIKFHSWYMNSLLENLKQLQELLSSHHNLTFSDILEDMYFGFKCILERKLQVSNNDFDSIERNYKENIPTTLESQRPDYARLNRRGQTLHFYLEEVDAQHRKSYETHPFTLNQMATECLMRFLPNKSSTETIFHTLALSSNFTINLEQINSVAWSNPEILRQLASYHLPAKIKCLQFVAALRMGCSPTDLLLENDGTLLKVSGFNATESGECDLLLLSELISLFPQTTILDLSSNGIRSLAPLTKSLKGLLHLKGLNLTDNPIHRPSPLSHLTQIERLILINTCIPKVALAELKWLISPTDNAEVLPNIQEDHYVNDQIGEGREREISLLGQNPFQKGLPQKGPSRLFKEINDLLQKSQLNSTDRDHIICILEHLSEAQWKQALSYGSLPALMTPEVLFSLFQPPFDPRPEAFKLLYALTHEFPYSVNPLSLSFTNNRTTFLTCTQDAACLRKLEISGPVILAFLETLKKFENLVDLKISCTDQPRILNYLPFLQHLEVLDLSRNSITSLSGLHSTTNNILKFPSLKEFIFSHNSLTSGEQHTNFNGISFLLELGNLRRIDLSHNQLTGIPKLGNIAKQLEFLDLRHNQIGAQDLSNTKNVDTLQKKFFFTPQGATTGLS